MLRVTKVLFTVNGSNDISHSLYESRSIGYANMLNETSSRICNAGIRKIYREGHSTQLAVVRTLYGA
jgi:hypothetical protein